MNNDTTNWEALIASLKQPLMQHDETLLTPKLRAQIDELTYALLAREEGQTPSSFIHAAPHHSSKNYAGEGFGSDANIKRICLFNYIEKEIVEPQTEKNRKAARKRHERLQAEFDKMKGWL